MAKHIFITGGVSSSLGKGINASSIGRLLKARGLKVFMQKMDPYINVDPGMMSPLQHGEVFITDDGTEADLDLGHYERFIDEKLNKYSSTTTGKIYQTVINREKAGVYGGGTIQVIPHITGVIKEAIYNAANMSGADVIITEIGGTVGDMEGLPFLEAIRQMRREVGYHNTYYIHNTLVPYLSAASEIKTKPTQHSIKQLGSLGINADMIILRTERAVSLDQKEKIAMFCDVDVDSVIEARDVKILYEVPLNLHKQNVDNIICKHLNLETQPIDLSEWINIITKIKNSKTDVKIALIGKYTDFRDSYISINESLRHAGYSLGVNVNIVPIKADDITKENAAEMLESFGGIIVPDGLGEKSIEGLINSIEYARVNKKPYLGICLGMHLAVIEYVQNALNYKQAHSLEFCSNPQMPIIHLRNGESTIQRLGSFECEIKPDTLAYTIYEKEKINERHKHTFELNLQYEHLFKNSDMRISSFSSENKVVEIVELKNHPFFIGCQFHPEFLSRVNRPHPLFYHFIKNIVG